MFVKGSLAQAHIAAQALDDLTQTKAAEVARATRKERSRKTLQKGGSMYIDEARVMVQQKKQDSLEVQVQQAQQALNVVTKTAENQVKKQWKEICKQM